MKIPEFDKHYDELCSFGNIEYPPAWYYKHFPSMFTPKIINSETDQFKRYITIDPRAGTTDNIQDYWNTDNAEGLGSNTNAQTNVALSRQL